jgi:hypothetical protein
MASVIDRDKYADRIADREYVSIHRRFDRDAVREQERPLGTGTETVGRQR